MGRHFDQGVALFQLHKNREAIEAFSRELAADNLNVAALAMRGAAQMACGNTRQAEEDVLGAIGLNPEYSYAFYLLSWLHYRLQGPRAALVAINEALRLDPNPVYFNQLARIYFDTGRYDESLAVAEQSLALDASDEDSVILRAKALAALGRAEEAREELRFALSLRADNPDAHKELGSLNLKEGEAHGALSHLLEARRIDPIEHNERLELAAAYGRLFWPFNILDAGVRYCRRLRHAERWLCVVGVATLILLVFLATGTSDASPSMAAGIALAIVFNTIVLRYSLDWIARVVSAFRLRRELDLSWGQLTETVEDMKNIMLVHGLATAAAVVSMYVPGAVFIAISLIVLGWDMLALLRRRPILAAIPLAAVSAIGIWTATHWAEWQPIQRQHVLVSWAGIVTVSFVLLQVRIALDRRQKRDTAA